MKPLIVLLTVFVLALAETKIIDNEWNFLFAGNFAMAIMLLFTALGHFKFADGMAMMLPNFVPFKKELVLLTGIIEIVAAIGLLMPDFRHLTSVLLILFFILILPANINAAINHIDHEKATNLGKGSAYLWFRIPLQVLFIGWVYYFGIN